MPAHLDCRLCPPGSAHLGAENCVGDGGQQSDGLHRICLLHSGDGSLSSRVVCVEHVYAAKEWIVDRLSRGSSIGRVMDGTFLGTWKCLGEVWYFLLLLLMGLTSGRLSVILPVNQTGRKGAKRSVDSTASRRTEVAVRTDLRLYTCVCSSMHVSHVLVCLL